MDKLKLDEALKLHRQLWEGVAKRITDDVIGEYDIADLKRDVLEEMNISLEEIINGCFICQYVVDATGVTSSSIRQFEEKNCTRCPMKWNSEEEDCKCYKGDSPYRLLDDGMDAAFMGKRRSIDTDYLRKLALEIANLPVKEGGTMDLKQYLIEEILRYARMIQGCMPRGKTIYFVPAEIEYKTERSRRKEETEQDE